MLGYNSGSQRVSLIGFLPARLEPLDMNAKIVGLYDARGHQQYNYLSQ